jgi:hypothetical protein
MNMDIFDIVIPLGPNERKQFPTQLSYLVKHVIGFRNIYIITRDAHSVLSDLSAFFLEFPIRIQLIDESIFPFSIQDVASVFYPKCNRNAWYFQQLLKLYAGSVVPGILSDYLVVDADVFFLKPTHFVARDKPFIDVGNEYHLPYFQHMNRLHPALRRMIELSGICHHMYFKQEWIQELFLYVETRYSTMNSQYLPFWKLFLLHVDEHKSHPIDFVESGASEYEIYFHFIVQFHSDEILLRKLNWENIKCDFSIESLSSLDYDFVSICHWMT